ncbi:MAG TPA: cation-translocating P-type ATPase [Pirellulales bacterium]|nr:cation-translocating P-type ATPase [Pirellulales bacterium]
MRQTPHAASCEQLLQALGGDPLRGLSAEQAGRRRAAAGFNALEVAPPEPSWKKFLAQFNGLVIWILIAAALIAGALGEWIDAVAILMIVLLNGVLGFVQEEKAERTLEALHRLSPALAKVVRSGTRQTLPARELAPGDLIELEAGDNVPADARLIESFSLQAMEAALTGESTPVVKDAQAAVPAEAPLGDRANMVFSGAVITAGKGKAIVVATGMQTQLGQIAGMLRRYKPEPTPLQRRLEELGRVLIVVCLLLVGAVFAIRIVDGGQFIDVFLFSISLAVAAVPEGLPAVVTIALALGLQRMAKRNALVRKLPSVETLGSVTVICSDKTGTLTRNEMTVERVLVDDRTYSVSGAGYAPHGGFTLLAESAAAEPISAGPAPPSEDLPPDVPEDDDLKLALAIAARCNGATVKRRPDGDGWQVIGDPMEGALVVAARKAGIEADGVAERTVAEIPFDSRRKLMSVVARADGRLTIFTKGAPEAVLARCDRERRNGRIETLDETRREHWMQAGAEMASETLRVLGFAYRECADDEPPPYREENLIFAGLTGMRDPPREEAQEALRRCRQAGVRAVMITGDHPATARAIAQRLSLLTEEGQLLTGEQLNGLSDEQLFDEVERIAVYARVSAEHKLRVIEALKKRGQIAAMTGDGINDAPAVQTADVGIAMGVTGVDVTKEASDIVLLDDNFASIVNAIEEGRGIFDNIQKVVHYLLSCNAGEVLFMFGAALAGWPMPLAAIQILWINLVTDGLPAIALATEPTEPDAMRRPPRPPREPIVTGRRGWTIVWHGALIAAASAASFWHVYSGDPQQLAAAQTTCFFVITLSQLFYAFSCRSGQRPFLALGPLTNLPLLAAVAASLLLQFALISVASARSLFRMTGYEHLPWAVILAVSLAPAVVVEASKWLTSFFVSRVGKPQNAARAD